MDCLVESLLDRFRAFAAVNCLEFYSIFDETSNTRLLFFEDANSGKGVKLPIDLSLTLSVIPDAYVEDIIFDAVYAIVEEKLLSN